jgi:hypothetical protein
MRRIVTKRVCHQRPHLEDCDRPGQRSRRPPRRMRTRNDDHLGCSCSPMPWPRARLATCGEGVAQRRRQEAHAGQPTGPEARHCTPQRQPAVGLDVEHDAKPARTEPASEWPIQPVEGGAPGHQRPEGGIAASAGERRPTQHCRGPGPAQCEHVGTREHRATEPPCGQHRERGSHAQVGPHGQAVAVAAAVQAPGYLSSERCTSVMSIQRLNL